MHQCTPQDTTLQLHEGSVCFTIKSSLFNENILICFINYIIDRSLRKLASDSSLVHPKRESMMMRYTHHTFKVS
jgi:hypothetical protein